MRSSRHRNVPRIARTRDRVLFLATRTHGTGSNLEVDRILASARVASAGEADAWQAPSLGFTDLEDALQAVSAEAGGAHWIITRDSAG